MLCFERFIAVYIGFQQLLEPLRSNGRLFLYCLRIRSPSRWLAVNVWLWLDTPAFRPHFTIWRASLCNRLDIRLLVPVSLLDLSFAANKSAFLCLLSYRVQDMRFKVNYLSRMVASIALCAVCHEFLPELILTDLNHCVYLSAMFVKKRTRGNGKKFTRDPDKTSDPSQRIPPKAQDEWTAICMFSTAGRIPLSYLYRNSDLGGNSSVQSVQVLLM